MSDKGNECGRSSFRVAFRTPFLRLAVLWFVRILGRVLHGFPANRFLLWRLAWPATTFFLIRFGRLVERLARDAEGRGEFLYRLPRRSTSVLFKVRDGRFGYPRPVSQSVLTQIRRLSQLFKSRVESHFRQSPENTPNGVD